MDMRKVIAPQRDMMASINAGVTDVPGMTDEATRYFRDLYDHLIRLADLVDSYRDLLSSVMDTHLSTVSNRLNVVMKQLTIIATIFLPLSFLTGLLRAELRLPGPGVAGAHLELLRARNRGSSSPPSSSSSSCSAAAAGWAARPSEPPGPRRVSRVAAERARGQVLGAGRRVHLVLGPPGLAAVGHREAELLAPVDQRAHRLLLLAHEGQRPGAVVVPGVAGPERLLEAPGLAAGLRDGVGALGDVGQQPASPSASTSAARSHP